MSHSIESITIETLTQCNARCLICPNNSQPRVPHQMPLTDFQEILAFFPNLKGVVLCGMYEPLLEPRLAFILDHIERIHPKAETTIFTNGSLLGPAMTHMLLSHISLHNIIVSIHGFSNHVYEKVMVGLDRDKVYSNVQFFMQERGTSTIPKVSVSFVRTIQNIHELETFRKFWKDKVDVVSDFEIMNWRGQVSTEQLLYETPKHTRSCPMFDQPLVIDAHGNIVRCCYDFSFNYGHVLDGGFERWQQKKRESETYPTADCKPCLGYRHY